MSLTPVIYVDNETVIGADNLNAIQDAILENESAISGKVSSSDYNPSTKTSAMTQEVGKDPNGKLWTEPSGGGAGLIIKGYYPTLQALIQAVPNPSVGDTYGVGTTAPYEIYMWSGTAWVDNGTIKGDKGDDGFSPEVTITETSTGHNVKITDATHPQGQTFSVNNGINGEDGEDGYSPAVTITQTTSGHNVTITDETHPQGQTFAVDNGVNGQDGEDGEDGYSPVITITQIAGGHRVTITDEAHPQGQSFDVLDGSGTGDMKASDYDPNSVVKNAGGIVEYVEDNGGKIDKIKLNGTEQSIVNKTVNLTPVATDIAFGETTVGAELTAQSSQIDTLNTTVGDASSGLVKDVADLQTDKQDKITTATASLTVAGWDGTTKTQTVSVSGVTASSTVWISPNDASHDKFVECGIRCSAQAGGSLTFKCKTIPTVTITVNVGLAN